MKINTYGMVCCWPINITGLILVLSLSGAWTAHGQAAFTGLGVPAGDESESAAAQVSADGAVAVGSVTRFDEQNDREIEQAFRWDVGGQTLLALPQNAVGHRALGVSVGGSALVGEVTVADAEAITWTTSPFRWTPAGGMVTLPMPEGARESAATAVSADGIVTVGYMDSPDGIQAFRWTQADGTQGLGFFPNGIESRALGVSGDGSVIVGFAHHADGIRAFRWTAQDGMQNLGILQGGKHSRAAAVSMNGTVIVGGVENEDGTERAFRWTSQQGMTELPAPQGTHSWVATSASSDGSVIVGQMVTEDGAPEAFVWDAVNGMRSVKAVLEAANVNVTGWRLDIAMGVAADGKTIVGAGVNPDGKGEAWRAVLP